MDLKISDNAFVLPSHRISFMISLFSTTIVIGLIPSFCDRKLQKFTRNEKENTVCAINTSIGLFGEVREIGWSQWSVICCL